MCEINCQTCNHQQTHITIAAVPKPSEELKQQRYPCKDCNKCTSCRGRGTKLSLKRVGPGLFEHSYYGCSECDGTGLIIEGAQKCKTCEGNGQEKKKQLRQDRFTTKLDALTMKLGEKIETENNMKYKAKEMDELNSNLRNGEDSVTSDQFTMDTSNNPYSLRKTDHNRIKAIETVLSKSLLSGHCKSLGSKTSNYAYKT